MDLDKPDLPRPYGPVGLILSLGGVLLIGCLALAVVVGAVAGVEYLVSGPGQVVDLAQSAQDYAFSKAEGAAETAGFVVGSLVYAAVIVGLVGMAAIRAGRGWPVLLAWQPFRIDLKLVLIILGGLVYGIVASAVVGWLYSASREWFTLPKAPVAVFASFVLVVVLAPLAEELFFRGWIFTALRWRTGFATTLVVTSVLFALAHWEKTHLYAAAVLPVGFVLGWIRERTGSTRASTLFHALYNFMGWGMTFLGMG